MTIYFFDNISARSRADPETAATGPVGRYAREMLTGDHSPTMIIIIMKLNNIIEFSAVDPKVGVFASTTEHQISQI